MQRYSDVGYHYMIAPGGVIYEGREIIFKGSHVSGANSRKIGVLVMGDFDEQWWDDDDEPSPTQLNRLDSLIRTLRQAFPGTRYLGGHTEFATAQGDERSCPGSLLISRMEKLRKAFGFAAPSKR
jgi:hypothetical protein